MTAAYQRGEVCGYDSVLLTCRRAFRCLNVALENSRNSEEFDVINRPNQNNMLSAYSHSVPFLEARDA